MNDFVGQNTRAQPSVQDMARDLGLKRFLLGIYQKMALGLLVTGGMAWAVAHTPFMIGLLYNIQDGAIRGYTVLGWAGSSPWRRWACPWRPAWPCAILMSA